MQTQFMAVSKAEIEEAPVNKATQASETQLVGIKQAWGKERIYLCLVMLLLALLYSLMPVYLDSPRMSSNPNMLGGFWSPDSGARFAMIRNWVDYGTLVHLHYRYSSIDPTGQIHPLAYFLFHRQHDFVAMYPTLFPFLSGLAYRAFGFYGLTLVPMLCGLGCLLVTYATAKRLGLRCRLLLVLAMGLATPLVIYSTTFWDHSALMLVAALSGYWTLRSVQDRTLRSAVIAGLMIGLGMWLHEQFLALFVAAWLAALPLLHTQRRLLIGMPLGFLAVVFVWGLFNQHVYGVFAGPHLGANVFQNGVDHPFSLGAILNLNEFADRAMAQLVGTTLPGAAFAAPFELWPYYLALACFLIGFTIWGWGASTTSEIAISLALSSIAAGLAFFLVLKITAVATPAGLFQATPLLIPALAIPWYGRPRKTPATSNEAARNSVKSSFRGSFRGMYYAWLSRACFLFLLFLLVNPMYPGTDWGSRYLLTALPLLALLAAFALERQYESLQGKWRGGAMVYTALIVGTSLVCQGSGLFWIHRMLAYDQRLNARIKSVSSAVLVTNADFNARLSPRPNDQARFLVRTEGDCLLFAKILRQQKIKDFTFVGVEGSQRLIEDALSESGGQFRVAEQGKLFAVDRRNEIGDEFQVTHFILEAKSGNREIHPISHAHPAEQSAVDPSLVPRYRFNAPTRSNFLDNRRSRAAASNATLVGDAAVGSSAAVRQPNHALYTNGSTRQASNLPASAFQLRERPDNNP